METEGNRWNRPCSWQGGAELGKPEGRPYSAMAGEPPSQGRGDSVKNQLQQVAACLVLARPAL